MSSEILVYLRLGLEHILDPRGYDHILFLVALTAVYAPREWLRVVVLVTAFTVGHTITLVLATLDLVRVPSDLVELLIALTILSTALLNAAELRWTATHRVRSDGRARDGRARRPARGSDRLRAVERRRAFAAGGAGGSGAAAVATAVAAAGAATADTLEPPGARSAKYALALCFGLIHGLGFSTFLRAALGAEVRIVLPLLSFNVGLELGQIAIVASIMALAGLATGSLRVPRRGWTLLLSGAAGVVALGLVIERLPG